MTDRDWLVVLHRHTTLQPVEPREVLPLARSFDPESHTHLVDIVDNDRVPAEHLNWLSLQREQTLRLTAALKEAHYGSAGVQYFGATYIPLALDLGATLDGWRRCRVYLRAHHGEHHWTWASEQASPLETLVEGLEGPVDDRPVELILRVSQSYLVRSDDCSPYAPHAGGDVHLRLAKLALDPFEAHNQLEAFAKEFREVIDSMQRRWPNARRIHLFMAAGVGAAFLLGTQLTPRNRCSIQTYQYSRRHHPAYQPALTIGAAAADALPAGAVRVLFLYGQNAPNSKLGLGEECRDIQRALESDPAGKVLATTIEHATEARRVQQHLDRRRPAVLHFSGHGTKDHRLVFAGDREPAYVAAADFCTMVQLTGGVRLVVLTACHTHFLASELTRGSACHFAIGTSGTIPDATAIAFSAELYRSLAARRNFQDAFDAAKASAGHLGATMLTLNSAPNHDPRSATLF